jgi:simple sugar transport system substrate-binding protein
MRRALLLCLVAVVLGGCGAAAEVRERDLVSDAPGAPAPRRPAAPSGADRGGVRIAVVTHGQASSGFWAIVKNGVDAAGRQMDVAVTYRSPDVYSVQSMSRQIDEAVASRPNGLVVSLPSPELDPAIRRAVRAGIPVVSMNSGADLWRQFGILAHVGQPEAQAGREAGERFAAARVRNAICINHTLANKALGIRCAAFARAMRKRGARSHVFALDVEDRNTAAPKLAAEIERRKADGVLGLGTGGSAAALDARKLGGRSARVKIGTFDLTPEVLEAIKDGRILFAVDQQAYLQGYMPIVMLTQEARYGLFPSRGEVVSTGPNFVTRETAPLALQLSGRGIR